MRRGEPGETDRDDREANEQHSAMTARFAAVKIGVVHPEPPTNFWCAVFGRVSFTDPVATWAISENELEPPGWRGQPGLGRPSVGIGRRRAGGLLDDARERVRCRGALPEPVHLARPVIVAGAGDDQIILRSKVA